MTVSYLHKWEGVVVAMMERYAKSVRFEDRPKLYSEPSFTTLRRSLTCQDDGLFNCEALFSYWEMLRQLEAANLFVGLFNALR